jgi:hypothetical protein
MFGQNRKYFGVGIDHPDLTGDRDKQNCFDCQMGLAIFIASMMKVSELIALAGTVKA